MNSVIATTNLTKKFLSSEAIHDLNLEVPEASIFGYLGPNGAGKTTTIKSLMNIFVPSSGSARVLGLDSRRLSPARLQKIGYVSENQELPVGCPSTTSSITVARSIPRGTTASATRW